MKGIVRNYRKELARRQAKEVSFVNFQKLLLRNWLSGTITKVNIQHSMYAVQKSVYLMKNLQKHWNSCRSKAGTLYWCFLLRYEWFGNWRKAEYQSKYILQAQKKFTWRNQKTVKGEENKWRISNIHFHHFSHIISRGR